MRFGTTSNSNHRRTTLENDGVTDCGQVLLIAGGWDVSYTLHRRDAGRTLTMFCSTPHNNAHKSNVLNMTYVRTKILKLVD